MHGQGHLPLSQVAPSPLQPSLGHFQEWGNHRSSGPREMTSSEYFVFLGSLLNILEEFEEVGVGQFSLQITLLFGPTNPILIPVPWWLSHYLVLVVPVAMLIPGLIDGSATDSLGCSSHALH